MSVKLKYFVLKKQRIVAFEGTYNKKTCAYLRVKCK